MLNNMIVPEHRYRRCMELIKLHALKIEHPGRLPLVQLEAAVQTEMLAKLLPPDKDGYP